MTEGLAFEPPDDEEPGWIVTGPDGKIIAAGAQTVTDASAGAGQE